jgi:hypothetical protein
MDKKTPKTPEELLQETIELLGTISGGYRLNATEFNNIQKLLLMFTTPTPEERAAQAGKAKAVQVAWNETFGSMIDSEDTTGYTPELWDIYLESFGETFKLVKNDTIQLLAKTADGRKAKI